MAKEEEKKRVMIKRIIVLCSFLSLLLTTNVSAQKRTDNVPIDTSRSVTINSIHFIGNKRTKPQIISRELNFHLGQKVKMNELRKIADRDEQKIFNLGLFNTATINILTSESDTVDIIVKVHERWFFFVIPIFKLIDRNFNDWWVNRNRDLSRVNYGIKAQHFNFRGRNEKLLINAQLGFTRNLSLGYVIPYIDKKQKSGLSFNVSYSERKNIAITTVNNVRQFLSSERILSRSISPSVTYTYRNGFFNRHAFTVDYNSINYADSVSIVNPEFTRNQQNRQQFLRFSYSFVRDVRDFRNYPLIGFLIGARVDRFGIGPSDEVSKWALAARFSKYSHLGKNFYFASTINGLLSTRRNQPYSIFNALGFGSSLVRGYELAIIESPRYVIQKSTVRKLLFKTEQNLEKFIPIKQFQKIPFAFYGKLFFDHGYAQSYPDFEGSAPLNDRYLYSIGAGIDIVSAYDFVVRFEFSRNADRQNNFFINFKAAL